MSSTDVLIYVDVISNKQSIFSSHIRTLSFPINWPSLVSIARTPNILYWSHKPSLKHDSNQSKAIVICDHKSDKTRSVAHVNKAYLVWLMFRVLSNQHYQHHTNQKLRSSAGKRFLLSPPPPPSSFFFFCSRLNFSRLTRAETLATQAIVNRTLKFRLTFLILLTINFPLTVTRREKSLFSYRDR